MTLSYQSVITIAQNFLVRRFAQARYLRFNKRFRMVASHGAGWHGAVKSLREAVSSPPLLRRLAAPAISHHIPATA